jgi:calcineurin-like phosphoesterase family protein
MKLTLNKGQKLWFTSDTHYNHASICSATTKWTDAEDVTRKFDSLEQMNQTLVANINSCVNENDILIHLGDWSFGGFEMIEEFRKQINCKNIHLVLGNHDHHIQKNKDDVQSLFTSVHEYLYLDLRIPKGKEVDKFKLVCMHYPITSWNGMNHDTIHLHGHVHLPNHLRVAQGKAMDVGVDGNHFYPIELSQVLDIMDKQPISALSLPKDHHVKRVAPVEDRGGYYGC